MDPIDVDDIVSRAINGLSVATASAAGLLKLFGEAGYMLSQYYQYYKSMQEDVCWVTVAANLLVYAGS